MISIQTADFDQGEQYKTLRENASSDGAIVTFTGLVRDFNESGLVSSIFIEHYPEMTQKSLQQIYDTANKRWELGQVCIIHRIGLLAAFDQIVFVGVTSKHRQSAFNAAEFIMCGLTISPIYKTILIIMYEVMIIHFINQ